LAREDELRARDLLEHDAARLADHVHLHDFQSLEASLAIAEEALGRDGVEAVPAPLLPRGDGGNGGPTRAGGVGARCSGGAGQGQDLELVDRARTLAVNCSEAVRAGVAASDDDHMFSRSADEALAGNRVTLATTVLERQVLHREMDPAQFPAWNWQIAWRTGS